jgi:hypothetical protein
MVLLIELIRGAYVITDKSKLLEVFKCLTMFIQGFDVNDHVYSRCLCPHGVYIHS